MTHEAMAGSSSASGQGGVVTASGSIRRSAGGNAIAAGGIIEGKGQIIRKDGAVIDFNLVSDPLTEQQAQAINEE